MECPVENHMDYPMDILRIILWNLLEYPAQSNGISYEILWNIIWYILLVSIEYHMEYLMEYPMEYPTQYPSESNGMQYEIP